MHRTLFNRALRVLLATNALIMVAGAMFGPIYALFVDQIGGDLLDAGAAGSVFALAAGFTTLISGRMTDKIKEKELVVVFGYLLLALGFTSYTFVTKIWHLLLVQILVGFAEAVYSPAFDALFSEHLTKKKEGRQWGAWESTFYFTAAAGALVGGYIASVFSFNVLFILMGLITLGSALHIYHLPRKLL